jgi:DNA primase catalytic core
MIPQETIERVLERSDIVDVISRYITLTKAGRDFVACCPFHGEKTASFHVSPIRQTWHCFGACQEGGNVISFVQKMTGVTFPEAVKQLAKQYGVEIEEEVEDPEKTKARLKREAYMIINQKVAKFYSSILQDKVKCPDAWNYAVSRWGQDYITEIGMGFAPKGYSSLLKWAEESGENIDFLVDLGLLKCKEETGKIYDAYRNRLMIPIRDRTRNIIGFTARDLSGEDNTAKYINSTESIIYHKRSSVFGIDEAYPEACKKEIWYLVEGAPDAMKMHSVGIDNAVAALGGSWTREQLIQLKKGTSNVCFINDADPIKGEDHYGAGIKYVMENGKLAIQLGLNVTVREITLTKDHTKQDPGSFFTSKSMLNEITEEDFISWLGNKIWDNEASIQKKTEVFTQLSELASYIEDDMKLVMVIDELNHIKRNKEFWKNAINKAKWKRNKESQEKNGTVDLRQYGFVEDNGGYVGINDKGEYVWSNFTMKPLFHIRDDKSPKRIFYIKNKSGRKEVVELTMEELVSVPKFQQKLEGLGNYQWMAGTREIIKLKSYLYSNTETARSIKQMGWNETGFYAFGNGLWMDGKFYKADELGICRLGEAGIWYIPAASIRNKADKTKYELERKFIHQDLQTCSMEDYLTKFIQVFGDNGKIGILYWMASCFRDIITGYTRTFPNLNLFGPKGSGKTELGIALMKFFMLNNEPPNLKKSTVTALNNAVAFACDAICHLDEYKNDIIPTKIEMLKGLYDGVGRTKMGGSDYQEIERSSVKSGVVISGQEMPTADIALFHRCIYLSFPKSEFTNDERRRFSELREIQRFGMTGMTLKVLENRKRMEARFKEYYNDVLNDINDKTNGMRLETRIVENWAKPLATMKVVEEYLPLPIRYSEMLDLCVKGILRQNKLSGTGNELAGFFNTFVYLNDNGEIFNESDYRIEKVMEIKTDTVERHFQKPKKILLINKNRIFMLYKKTSSQVGNTSLPEDSLRVYLENADYYLGKKKGVRFKTIIKGVTIFTPTLPGTTPHAETRVLQAMAFDYDVISERYGINLVSEFSEHNDIETIDQPEEKENKLPF